MTKVIHLHAECGTCLSEGAEAYAFRVSRIDPYVTLRDITLLLKGLVEDHKLVPDGQGRATSYRLAGAEAVDLANSAGFDIPTKSSEGFSPSSEHLETSSEHLKVRSEHFAAIDLTKDPTLLQIADPVRSNKHCLPEMTRQTIRNLCQGKFLTLNQLATLLNRSSDGLRQLFIKPMVDDEKVLERRFPQQPNHEQQAYRTRES